MTNKNTLKSLHNNISTLSLTYKFFKHYMAENFEHKPSSKSCPPIKTIIQMSFHILPPFSPPLDHNLIKTEGYID